MNVAAGQTARPSIAGNFTTTAPEKQHLPAPVARAPQFRPRARLTPFPERGVNPDRVIYADSAGFSGPR